MNKRACIRTLTNIWRILEAMSSWAVSTASSQISNNLARIQGLGDIDRIIEWMNERGRTGSSLSASPVSVLLDFSLLNLMAVASHTATQDKENRRDWTCLGFQRWRVPNKQHDYLSSVFRFLCFCFTMAITLPVMHLTLFGIHKVCTWLIAHYSCLHHGGTAYGSRIATKE